jgi:broad specificity phosphatase PhoE
MITTLLLIRHAQTQWNLKKRYSGFIDIGLNDRGREQAKSLRQRLKKEAIHKVYSSDRLRAMETARIIFKGMRIEKAPELREMHFGIFEGKTYQGLMKKHSLIYIKWLKDPFSINIPQAENLNNFKRRVIRAFRKIIRLNKGKTVAVVSHAGVISIFINSILKSKDFWKYIPNSGSLSIIEYKNGKVKIRLLNDTSHLS